MSESGFTQVKMSDHEFSKYLREKDSDWTWHVSGNSNVFTSKDSKEVYAVTIHDNAKCTRKIFIKEEKENKKENPECKCENLTYGFDCSCE